MDGEANRIEAVQEGLAQQGWEGRLMSTTKYNLLGTQHGVDTVRILGTRCQTWAPSQSAEGLRPVAGSPGPV